MMYDSFNHCLFILENHIPHFLAEKTIFVIDVICERQHARFTILLQKFVAENIMMHLIQDFFFYRFPYIQMMA